MKVVVDTNVFISGVFWSGAPARILDAWRHGEIDVYLSATIFEEYQRVGQIMTEKVRRVDLDAILRVFVMKSSIVAAGIDSQRFCDDPDDDKFILCALAAGGAIVVSGDKHLLRVTGKFGVQVFTPADFVRKYLD
jgi:putative PIN family toxin of toxin-antitoxin system